MNLHKLPALVALSIFWVSTPAGAQETAREPRGFSIDRFRPSMDGEGVLDVEWAVTRDLLEWDVALWLNYANDPLNYRLETSAGFDEGPSPVAHRLGGNFVAAIGLLPWLQVGLDMPVLLHQTADDDLETVVTNGSSLASFATGDLRLRPKVQLLRAEHVGVDVAVIPTVSFPTASSSAYVGEKTFGFEPELVISKGFTALRLSANLGYRARKRVRAVGLVVDDEFWFRVGAAYALAPHLGVPIELGVTLSGAAFAKAPFEREKQSPLEALFGAFYDPHERVRVFAAAGPGLRNGFGTPDFRILTGVRFHTPGKKDSDGDGILDNDDRCPQEPEDRDGFEDEDGCIDRDNDGDGVPDAADGAPMQPEDKDGFEDDDGVPDPDNDGDGILDGEDECPVEAGVPENSGCPDADSDGDGVVDRVDQCVDDPEDNDGFEDEDGCPDPDNDGDGLADDLDRCPNESGPTENAGCPDTDRDGDGVVDRNDQCPDVKGSPDFRGCAKPQKVMLTAEKIEILEKVYFDGGNATIQARSHELLDNVAEVLIAHPAVKKIRVEGHTDSRGSASLNQDLSQRRAEAVVAYLAEKGVDTERLEAVGYGEDKPIASNKSRKGRSANRRVEFTILGDEEPKKGE